jgi:uncharacterized membrane-anchored protein YjiN (DUF445 family)
MPHPHHGHRARLKRMQLCATGVLVLMAFVFLASSLVVARWPIAAYVRAFAEAAVVGGCADWFAVTALFRRPMGLPIPHTALIPRNKDRIGEALGRFVVENFLSARVLDAKLKQLELSVWGGAWLQEPRNRRVVATKVLAWGPELFRTVPADTLEALAAVAVRAAAKAVPAAPTASAVLAALWNDGRAQPLIERAAALLRTYLADHEDVILDQVQSQSWKWLPTWVDRAIARKITGGLVRLLADVEQPDHPWRLKLKEVVESLVLKLATDPKFARQGEALKLQLLDDPRLSDHASRLWSEIQQHLQASWPRGSQAAQEKIEQIVADLGVWLAEDPVVQRTLNTGARALVRQVLAPRREDIGRFIAQVVRSWDARDVVERLELQVGADLQYIRISGALVGGIVGLALFTLSRALRLR